MNIQHRIGVALAALIAANVIGAAPVAACDDNGSPAAHTGERRVVMCDDQRSRFDLTQCVV